MSIKILIEKSKILRIFCFSVLCHCLFDNIGKPQYNLTNLRFIQLDILHDVISS